MTMEFDKGAVYNFFPLSLRKSLVAAPTLFYDSVQYHLSKPSLNSELCNMGYADTTV